MPSKTRYGAQETPEMESPPTKPIWWFAEALAPTPHGVTNTFIWTRLAFDARQNAQRVLRLEEHQIRLVRCSDYPHIFSKTSRATSRMLKKASFAPKHGLSLPMDPTLFKRNLNGKPNGH